MKEGLYEQVINKDVARALKRLNGDFIIDTEEIDKENAKVILSSYVSSIIRRALDFVRENTKDDKEKLLKQIEACNRIISILSEVSNDREFEDFKIDENGEILTALYSKINNIRSINYSKAIRPITPLSQSSLFTGSKIEPNMLNELKKEILTSDSIDLLVSFIKWSGIRCIMDELKEFNKRDGVSLRIITTSYMGATDYKAIEELSKLSNTSIRISYDTERTRLHAKAYMFKRKTGFTTAYIGSSNLSNAALTSGMEWNLKVTEKDSFDIIRKFEATFESYFNDLEFVPFKGEKEDLNRLKWSLKRNSIKEDRLYIDLDIRPYAYQKEILDKLDAEREIFNHYRNLLVAATGTGKTVISAFDYKRFCMKNRGKTNKLLFVAHRQEILKQSRDTFRVILRDNNFGEVMVGDSSPESFDNLFVSIQSLNSKSLAKKTSDDFYDFIIVDEFHHAAADSYRELLSYYKPKVFLGLTATPERNDNREVFSFFDNRISAEIRLPEAIDRKLLSPFQYFCVSDSVDLSSLKWGRRGYDVHELNNIYTNNDIRSSLIVDSLNKYVTDIDKVIGIGFCVSIEHAKYMSTFFNHVGISSIALFGCSSNEERSTAKRRLANGEIKFIFVVDLYNEGVDIPEINTIMFLRPTESLTLFIQQLGRGLRLSEGKECLTVLDFVGRAHNNYNFEEKFRSLVGKTNHSIRHYIENNFSYLPKGCYIQLEKQAKEYILRNIKSAVNNKANIINRMKSFKVDTMLDLTLGNFLNYYNLSLEEFYGRSGDRNFSRMMVLAGLDKDFIEPMEVEITKRLRNIFHINSRRFIKFIIDVLKGRENIGGALDEEKDLMLNMMYYTFFVNTPEKEGYSSMETAIEYIMSNKTMTKEIEDILRYNYNNLSFVDKNINLGFNSPLDLHCKYSRDQIMASFGYFNGDKKPAFREGVKYFSDKKIDIFFITLNKADKDYSPSTLYEDYAINENLFHWQSQSTTSVESTTGQRYIKHRSMGSKIALFVREENSKNGITSPYTYLGLCNYVSHKGSKPISFVFELEEEIPSWIINKANKSIII